MSFFRNVLAHYSKTAAVKRRHARSDAIRSLPRLVFYVVILGGATIPPLLMPSTDAAGTTAEDTVRYLQRLDMRFKDLASTDLAELTELDLANSRVDDNGLNYLATLPKLDDLNLAHTKVTDRGLVSLNSLRNLTSIDLSHTFVRHPFASLGAHANLVAIQIDGGVIQPDDMQCAKTFARLLVLSMDNSNITDKMMEGVGAVPSLTNLSLSRTRIGDVGLAQILPLRNLVTLDVSFTHVSDAGLMHLTKFTRLTHLQLTKTKITDAGLMHVRKMTNLGFLQMNDTEIGDAGFLSLTVLSKLEQLWILNTAVTKDAVTRFQKLRPKTKILYGELPRFDGPPGSANDVGNSEIGSGLKQVAR